MTFLLNGSWEGAKVVSRVFGGGISGMIHFAKISTNRLFPFPESFFLFIAYKKAPSFSRTTTQGIERYEYQKSELPVTVTPHYNCRDLHSKTFPYDLRPCHPPLPHTLIVTQKPAAAQGTDLLFPRSTYTGLNPAPRLPVPAVWQQHTRFTQHPHRRGPAHLLAPKGKRN